MFVPLLGFYLSFVENKKDEITNRKIDVINRFINNFSTGKER